MNYDNFIHGKHSVHEASGFKYNENNLPFYLKPWQRKIVAWCLLKGRAAMFEDCGLGKTVQQLVWADVIHNREDRPILILTPLAVAPQTVAEGEKFGIHVKHVREDYEVINGINVCNYERIDKIDTSRFLAVVLDESSILKSFMGKTKQSLIKAFSRTKYRLCCTATPSPNDISELGNHADFLGVMKAPEMLTRFFINDTTESTKFRLKGHAIKPFWEWISSWAVCISSPADLGYDDEGYKLPQKHTILHTVKSPHDFQNGMLIPKVDTSSIGIRHEMKKTFEQRCYKAAEIANSTIEPVVVWCETNAESKLLTKLIPDAIEVEGSMTADLKVKNLTAFSNGSARVIVTKPKLAGFGLNWQHCNISICVGLSYSFEQRYQALRRIWRFGQTREVFDHICMGENERKLHEVQMRKQASHEDMARQMAIYVNSKKTLCKSEDTLNLVPYQPQVPMSFPAFL